LENERGFSEKEVWFQKFSKRNFFSGIDVKKNAHTGDCMGGVLR
jgi:hypothetical protein